MVIGIPNVGKSTLINRLRQKYMGIGGRPSRVGAMAGVTQSVQNQIKICANPPVYLFDTPGVLEPKFDKSVDATLRAALCATIKDEQVGWWNMADYLLWWMNKHENFSYVDFLQLDGPTDIIGDALATYCRKKNHLTIVKLPDGTRPYRPHFEIAAQHFITAFRKGKFGKIFFDVDHLPPSVINEISNQSVEIPT